MEALIIIAAFCIIYVAAEKWITGLYLENLGRNHSYHPAAIVINALLGWISGMARQKSVRWFWKLTWQACAHRFMEDLGVLVGLGLTLLTGLAADIGRFCADFGSWTFNIPDSGWFTKALPVLMDQSRSLVQGIVGKHTFEESERYSIRYHELKHRSLGSTYWVEVHLLFQVICPFMKPLPDYHGNRKSHRELLWSPSAVIHPSRVHRDHSRSSRSNRHNL